jgi:hydroxymethylbilane synthase
MTIKRVIRIGTRGSRLALAQAHQVRESLRLQFPDLADRDSIEIVKIKTTGDMIQSKALSEVGGKGLFSKEIDRALVEGAIDIAVHSLKDLETYLFNGISLISVLKREDVRDAMLSHKVDCLSDLPGGSVIGTSSVRRQAQISRLFPQFKCVVFRGNIETRLRKLKDNEVDATLLAMAGLNRLGMGDMAKEIFEPDVILPAVGQGALGITCRTDDITFIKFVREINHQNTMIRIKCERAMLAALDGSCSTPVGGLALIEADGRLHLRGMVFSEDGNNCFQVTREGDVGDSELMGKDAGDELYQMIALKGSR